MDQTMVDVQITKIHLFVHIFYCVFNVCKV